MAQPSSYQINTHYIKQIQQQQIELRVLKSQLDDAVRDRAEALDLARAQSDASTTILEALVGSLRRYGLNRKKFVATMRKAARELSASDPSSVQHTVLFEATNKVLKSGTI